MNRGDFFSKFYPMQYGDSEIQRLNHQANELFDPMLAVLARDAENCLEIGCGAGSNLPFLRSHNPDLNYTGIDLNEFAIGKAKETHGADKRAQFLLGDGQELPFATASFDLVICKLVLWSVGPTWNRVIQQAHTALASGGCLYCFEPDDQFLLFWPKKPAFESMLHQWQEKVVASGLDPFIGRKLYSALLKAGFANVVLKPFQNVSTGESQAELLSHLDNMKGLFLGRGPEYFGLKTDDPLWLTANEELSHCYQEDLFIETHMVAIGRKD